MQPKITIKSDDDCLQRILHYMRSIAFNGDLVLTCVADISRNIGQNPRTVLARINHLLDSGDLQDIDHYPRVGRSMVNVYRLSPDLVSPCPHPTSSD